MGLAILNIKFGFDVQYMISRALLVVAGSVWQFNIISSLAP